VKLISRRWHGLLHTCFFRFWNSSFWEFLLFIFIQAFFSISANATAPTSFRQPNPIAWQHQLPTGEMPGWTNPFWFDFEVNTANVWNAPLTMTDKRNNNTYEYTGDYEQTSAILEIGGQIFPRVAFSIEIPYAYRGAGFLDDFIDDFHVAMGNRRFSRNEYPEFQTILSVKTNGEEFYPEQLPLRDVANLKPKLKFWLFKWYGEQEGSCPCGLSVSVQAKIPTVDEKYGGTTGRADYSYLGHLGVPLFRSSAMWFTGAYTKLGNNPAIQTWPRKKSIQMYELNFDFAVTDGWGILLMGRAESPFLDSRAVGFTDASSDPVIVARNRAGSGFTGLVHWRGTEGLGLRYRSKAGDQTQFLVAEDWGFGNYDTNDGVYSNGAPDVNFIFQTRFEF
jgi:hypothetical protein